MRRFIFPGKERRKNPTQKAYFIRAERKKRKEAFMCFQKKNLCVSERRSFVIEKNDISCSRFSSSVN